MPVMKVPVQHKFGIVSLSRAEQLLAQGQEKGRTPRPAKTSRLPSEITRGFILKYNATPERSRDHLDGVVRRALLHAKFKAGLHHQGGGVASPAPPPSPPTPTFADPDPGPDLADAWLELTLLCQCYGQYQEEVLVTLATSLNHAPVSTTHIPSLLYVAGLCYQWLKSDIIAGGKELRSGELLLLKILYCVSLRLFYHHLTETLQNCCTKDEVRQLKFDLEGFESREPTYRNFPEALLHWKVALEVGLLVCESYSKPLHDPSVLTPDQEEEEEPTRDSSLTSQDKKPTPSSKPSKATPGGTLSSTAGPAGHEGHRLTPTLWHALDIWQCTRQESLSLDEAMDDMVTCSIEFHSNNWLEGMLALDILCAASETNMSILNLVQSLAEGSCRPHNTSERDHDQGTPGTVSGNGSLPHSPAPPQLKATQLQDTSLKLPEDNLSPLAPMKGTRFQLPVSQKGSTAHSQMEKSERRSSNHHMVTLNILGMQPQFRDPYPEQEAVLDDDLEDVGLNFGVRFQDRVRAERTARSPVDSVGTQSLLENESIPDTLSSNASSNTIVDLGPTSSTSLEGFSQSKGFLTGTSGFQTETPKPSGPLSSSELTTAKSGSGNSSGKLKEKRISLDDAASLLETRMSPVAVTPIEEKLEALQSPLDEAIDRVGLLNDRFEYVQPGEIQPGRQHLDFSGRSVALSLPPRNTETRCTHYTHSSGALSGGAGVPGSHVAPSTVYRHSVFSVPLTLDTEDGGSTTGGNMSRFENWPSEVAVAYTLNLASIAIYGRTSLIQKTALQGKGSRGVKDAAMSAYGLLQLTEFSNEGTVSKCDFTSWTIRHGAVLGLSRVCKVCRHVPMKDGLSNVAWTKLVERDSEEKDGRVLEAYKLSQACPDLDGPMFAVDRQPFSSPLIAHLADSLAQIFIPAFTPAPDVKQPHKGVKVTTLSQSPTRRQNDVVKNTKPRVVTRLSPRDAPPPPGFTTRMGAALNKIAEEHWRRQMQQELEEEEQTRKEEEDKERQDYAEKMKRKTEKLAKRRPKGVGEMTRNNN